VEEDVNTALKSPEMMALVNFCLVEDGVAKGDCVSNASCMSCDDIFDIVSA
jgi:hypothetical protein